MCFLALFPGKRGLQGYYNCNVPFLGDCGWEVHTRKKELTIERKNSLQVILLKS